MSVLKERVSGVVKFVRLADSELWYACEDGYEFPIPLEDTKGATFLAEDKGMFFMRWITRHMDAMEAARAEQSALS